MCKVVIHSDKSEHYTKSFEAAIALVLTYSGTLATVETLSHVYTLEIAA